MKLYPATEISNQLNISSRAVFYRFKKLGIKGIRKDLMFYFTEEEIEQISYSRNKVQTFPLLSNPRHYQLQIIVLITWMRQNIKNGRKISREYQIPITFVEQTIKLFKQRDCLIIQSKINRL